MASTDIGTTGVDELTVNFVGEEIEVILLHEIANLIHLATGIKVARRVVWVADEDGAGSFVDEFLELLYLRQRETLVNSGCDGTYDCAPAEMAKAI